MEGEPALRVALVVDAPLVTIAGQGRMDVRGAGSYTFEGGEEAAVVPAEGGVRVEGRSDRAADEIRFEAADRSGFLLVNGRPYRGSVVAYSRNGSVFAVNELGIEAYLRGVVSAEMGPRDGNEVAALEAQAIVSRTYALSNRGRFSADGYDIRATITDQAYVGVAQETTLGNAAVNSTRGLVVAYGGRLASVFFHSTCGYSTALPSEAFRSVRDVEYLRPVSDRRPSGGYYCDISPRFRWQVEWEGPELRNILQSTIPAVLGVEESWVDVVRGVNAHQTGRSGRITELRVVVGRGEIPVFGPDVRAVLRTPEGRPLGSTAIEIAATSSSEGVVEHLRVSGAGWGHGVGMCQWGAVGRARAGQSAASIIAAYFPGTRIERWY